MANITVTKTGNILNVDFGNYVVSSDVDGKKASYQISDISIVWLEKDESIVHVKMKDSITTIDWKLSFEATPDAFVVDSVDDIEPTSNQDLMDKINALR